MSIVRSRHLAVVALVASALLIVSGLVSPAQAAISRTLSISASPTTTFAGAAVTFAGKISRSPRGTVVRFQRKSGSTWVTVTSTRTTTAAGNYTRRITMPKTAGSYYFRATATKTRTLRSATSRTVKIVALRRVTATIRATPSVIELGNRVTLSGKIFPFVAGKVAFIQRFNGAAWTDVTTATISRTGTYSRSFSPIATTTYRVFVPRSGLLAAAVSPSTKLTVSNGPIAPVITTTTMPDGRTETAYSKTLIKDGKPGTWAITDGSLPPGLSLNPSTGAVTGTPTVIGDFTFKATFSESATALNDSQALSVHVDPVTKITTVGLQAATAFANYSQTLTKSGLAGVWSVTGNLPTGVTLNAGSGVLSGRPTVAGTFPLIFKFTETGSGAFASKSLPLVVDPAPDPVITTTSLPDAIAFADYAASVVRTGNAGVWSIISGTLPTGVTFDPATGALSGKPTVAGTYPLTFRFTETESGAFASKALTLTVDPAPDPVISTTTLPTGLQDSAYNGSLAVSTPRPGSWSVTVGALPTGITLNAATGALAGTPTVSGAFSMTFTFTETESGTFADKALSITILSRPEITTGSLPDGTRGQSYGNRQLFKTGGSGSGTWTLSGGSLPTGLTLSTAGVISGTPTELTDAANENFTVRFTDSVTGASTTKVLSIHIAMPGAPTFNTARTLPDATVGTSYSKTLSASGGVGARWSVVDGSLPPGLSLSAVTGEISGTPTTAGAYAFVARYGTLVPLVNNTRQFTILVKPAP